MGCHVAPLNKVVNAGPIEKVALERRLEGGEEASWADVRE